MNKDSAKEFLPITELLYKVLNLNTIKELNDYVKSDKSESFGLFKYMNEVTTREYLPILQAYADGKTIQLKSNGEWVDVGCVYPEMNPAYRYRIKPDEPRTFELWICIRAVNDWNIGDIRHDKPNPIFRSNWEPITLLEVIKN